MLRSGRRFLPMEVCDHPRLPLHYQVGENDLEPSILLKFRLANGGRIRVLLATHFTPIVLQLAARGTLVGSPHTLSTKLSTTRFSPAWSNLMVSLLPSTAVTLPLPNFW